MCPFTERIEMGRMAILVDGGFYLKRAKSMKGEKTPKDRANELIRYCMAHTSHEDAELYRIFYYDCDPIGKKAFHPLHNRTFDQSKTRDYAWKNEFFDELAKKRKVAIRKGETLDGSCEYVLKDSVAKSIVLGKRQLSTLGDEDFVLDVQQKGVDVRIGLDLALIVQRINEALIECGAHRYDYLVATPMVYEVDDHGEEWVRIEGVDHKRANVSIDSLPALMTDIRPLL